MQRYTNPTEISAVIEGFESCRTDKDAFTHLDHLTVAVVYLQTLSVGEAVTRMRQNLLHFLDHHEVDRQKYNQTITVFWFELVADLLSRFDTGSDLVAKCNAVLEAFESSGLVFDYYSRERLFSNEARETFLKPDLKD